MLEIAAATLAELPDALRLVFSNLSPSDGVARSEAALEEVRRVATAGAGVIAARRDKRLVGAAYMQVLPGRSAAFWLPQLVAEEPEETADEVSRAGLAFARAVEVRVVHALLSGSPADREVARLERVGFRHLADLLYLLAGRADFPSQRPPGVLEFEPYGAASYERLCRVVEATYEGTCDCPGLDDVRHAAEVLEGYGAGPGSEPAHWSILRHEDRDVGCLLLGDYPEHGNVELTYMGLIPSVRGNGWGLQVARQAQWIAGQLGRSRVVLAVDGANNPAREMYTVAGFRGWDRRQVYLQVLD